MSTPAPCEFGSPAKYTEWRDGQDQLFWDILDSPKRFSIHNAPTGMGKTVAYITAALAQGKRVAVLTESKTLQDQIAEDFGCIGLFDMRGLQNYTCVALAEGGIYEDMWRKRWGKPTCDIGPCTGGIRCDLKDQGCNYFDDYRRACGERLVSTNYAYWMAINRFGQGLGKFDLLVLDECFVPGTPIDGIPIERVCVGDKVSSFDERTGCFVTKSVTRIYRNPVRSLLRISFSNGSVLNTTPTHPFHSNGEWVPAASLHVGDTVLCSRLNEKGNTNRLYSVRYSNRFTAFRQTLRKFSEAWSCLLLTGVRQASAQQGCEAAQDVRCSETDALEPYESKQPNEIRASSGEATGHTTHDALAAENTGRQRKTTTCSANAYGSGSGVGDRSNCVFRRAKRWISDTLQTRYSRQSVEGGDRSGWRQSSFSTGPVQGREKNGDVTVTRVDSIEILERGSDGTFGGLCPDGIVYNLEVEDTHTYIADGIVVHNCHLADSQLASALSVEFNQKDFKELGSHPPKVEAGLQAWRMWGRVNLQRCTGKLDFFARSSKIGAVAAGVATFVYDSDIPDATEIKFWKKLESKCRTLAEASDDWVVDRNEDGAVRISPVWVRNYAESALFRGIPRVVMMSATVRPKIADLLNISDADFDYFEYPSTFPVDRRPIYWVPTLRLNHKTSTLDLQKWVDRIDAIIELRLDRKGIVHTVSYERQRFLVEHSRFREYMHWNTSGNTKDVVKSFKNAPPPAILVSPSVGTGFDFAFDLCRYQIIGKVPFRDTRGKILEAQTKEDATYPDYLTSQDLTQMYGRPNRDKKDFSETFCVDDSIEWFLDRYSGWHYSRKKGRFMMREPRPAQINSFFPYYFLEAFQRINEVPDPPSLEDISSSS